MAKKKRKSSKRAPRQLPRGWSWYSNGPLKGCGLLRERQWIYAWDDSNTIYLLDLQGSLMAQQRAPREVLAVSAADTTGTLVAISRAGHIWWLDGDLQPRVEISCPFDPLSVAVDSHGYYAVVSSQHGASIICDHQGKQVGDFETSRPLKHLAFAPASGLIIGAAEHGVLSCHTIRGQEEWNESLWSNVGSLALDGEGEIILLACFNHGLARYDAGGGKEGVYRFDYSPSLVAVDYEGSTMLVASLEQYLTDLTYEGAIRANKPLSSRPVSLTIDPLARYGVLGYADGELQFFTLPEVFTEQASARAAVNTSNGGQSGGQIADPQPAWETRAAYNSEEVASAVLDTVPGTDHVAVYTNRKTLRIFDGNGELYHESEGITGIGRIIRHGDRWLAAASDSKILAYDPVANESMLNTMPVFELSNLALLPKFGEAMLIESCERVYRLRLPEEKVWKRQMEYAVESMAVLKDGTTALASDDRNVVVYDATGKLAGKFRARRPYPLQLVAMDETWVSVDREARIARGHEPDGSLLWTASLPWAPWSSRRLGEQIVITNADGLSLLVSAEGEVLGKNDEPREGAQYFLRSDGTIARMFRSDQTLIVTSFAGQLLWRKTDEHAIGPFLAGPAGVWVFLGRLLTFFPF